MKRRAKVFAEEEMVLAHMRKERFPMGTYNKLENKKIGPCIIFRKISENTYKLDLSRGLDISSIFNVADLYEFHEGDNNEEIVCPPSPKNSYESNLSKKGKKFWPPGLERRLTAGSIWSIWSNGEIGDLKMCHG